MVQTVVKEQYNLEKFSIGMSPLDDPPETQLVVELHGQSSDRSFEDRDVYFEFEVIKPGDNECSTCQPKGCMRGWFRAEDAIFFGQQLIEHGRRSLVANMINHQHIHMMNQFIREVQKGTIVGVTLKMVDEHPTNYGPGFRTYQVVPICSETVADWFQEVHTFETAIYWSPFEEEYQKQLSRWRVPVTIEGYDRESELVAFNKACGEFSQGTQVPYDGEKEIAEE